MFGRSGSVNNIVNLVLTGLLFLALGQAQEIHLKGGRPGTLRAPMPSGRAGNRHVVMQFDHPPNSDDNNALASIGAKVVAALPDQALMVSLPANAVAPANVIWSGALQTTDKLSRDLLKDGWNAVVVEFHSDVTTELQDQVGSAEGFFLIRNARLRTGHALAYGSFAQLAALAVHDEVAYIFPADEALAIGGEIHACAGMLTQNGPVAQYANIVHGWDLDSDGAANLSYVFGEMSNKLPALEAQTEIVRALKMWSLNANVTFKQATDASSPRTIFVRVVSGAHGDPFPFDGPGGVLAHTFYPVPVNSEPLAGDMHLDADENWHIGGDIDLFSVALHEAGHAIGLGHSDKPGDVMYPYYRTGMRLSGNDIAAARQLYGAPAIAPDQITSNPPPTVLAPPVPPSNLPPAPPPVAAPVLTVNAAPASVSSAIIALGGSISGGIAPVTVTWQNGRLASGKAVIAPGGEWSVASVPLQPGINIITINAMDAGHRSTTSSASVTYSSASSISGGDSGSGSSAPLTLTIQSPSSSVFTTAQPTITIAGMTGGGTGISSVTWRSSTGYTGSASLSGGRWTASNVPLLIGTNSIMLQAIDSSGASVWSSLIAVRH